MKNVYSPTNARFIADLETDFATASTELDHLITDRDMLDAINSEHCDVLYLIPTGVDNPLPSDVIGIYIHDWAGCILAERTDLIDLKTEQVRAVVYDALSDIRTDKHYEITIDSSIMHDQSLYVASHVFKERGTHVLDGVINAFFALAVCLTKDLEECHWSDEGYERIKDMARHNKPLALQVNKNAYTLQSVKQIVKKEVVTLVDHLEDI